MNAWRTAVLLWIGATMVGSGTAGADLLDPVREAVAARRGEPEPEDPSDAVTRALMIGEHDRARELVPRLPDTAEGRILTARTLLARGEFQAVQSVVDRLQGEDFGRDDARRIVYRWWRIQDDLARIAGVLETRPSPERTLADVLAEADLLTLTLRYDPAERAYRRALEMAETDPDRGRAEAGLGTVAYRRKDFDAALEHHTRALSLSEPDPDLLMSLAQTLIRHGRTDEAIDAQLLAVEIAPYHERSHYMLGNGYSRKNYTQLLAAYPDAFADEAGANDLAAADHLWETGRREEAEAAYLALARAHPGWADVQVRLGSFDFARGRHDAALERFAASLAICPEYGRAHNGLAKAIEAKRLAVEVHRQDYELWFSRAQMPEIPGIETFVLNWNALTPRHQKSVALSVEPWQRFLPPLIEGGLTYYIKPLYMLLSETPGQELLRDQRISYDSRLWDDVRGCGGYHTVTGIEDVERTIRNRYNTVLHELTHQVHRILPSHRSLAIDDLYRRTKERADAGEDAFLSRYAGGSVWEYFAEGANALYSPRRDDFDTREIVRERLIDMDPELLALVESTMFEASVESCYAVAYAGRGDEALERGRVEDAIAAYENAVERSPDEESVLASLLYGLTVGDQAPRAARQALEVRGRMPESGRLLVEHARALRHLGDAGEAVELLRSGFDAVREPERLQVLLALGGEQWTRGEVKEAKRAYRAALEIQSDEPQGLWGLAATLALDETWDEAWEMYDEAVQQRTGVVALRCDYARDLLRAGEVARAREHIDAALLLDDRDPTALGLLAWVQLEAGDAEAAAESAARALDLGPWSDLSRIIAARVAVARGNGEEARELLAPLRERIRRGAPPSFVYRDTWGRYDEVHTHPEVERGMLADLP